MRTERRGQQSRRLCCSTVIPDWTSTSAKASTIYSRVPSVFIPRQVCIRLYIENKGPIHIALKHVYTKYENPNVAERSLNGAMIVICCKILFETGP